MNELQKAVKHLKHNLFHGEGMSGPVRALEKLAERTTTEVACDSKACLFEKKGVCTSSTIKIEEELDSSLRYSAACSSWKWDEVTEY